MLGPFLIRGYNTKEKNKDKIETNKEKWDNYKNLDSTIIDTVNQLSTLNSRLSTLDFFNRSQ